eukprot:4146989-Amphidinium_carterae.1
MSVEQDLTRLHDDGRELKRICHGRGPPPQTAATKFPHPHKYQWTVATVNSASWGTLTHQLDACQDEAIMRDVLLLQKHHLKEHCVHSKLTGNETAPG